jgi:Uma2 family endonuclease
MIEAAGDGYREVDGTPDMVLEIVSQTSVRKDTVDLRRLYWLAGIPEYWLVDARTESVQFDILKRGTRSYLSTRKAPGGWLKSNVFGASFRLKRKMDQLGNPQFELEMKS